jgi:hypothetical protein
VYCPELEIAQTFPPGEGISINKFSFMQSLRYAGVLIVMCSLAGSLCLPGETPSRMLKNSDFA